MQSEFSPNNKEIQIINEIMEYMKEKFGKETIVLLEFEVFEPLTPEWKSNFKNYAWGSNGVRIHFNESPVRFVGLIRLTRCKDTRAFYELVFHEIYELRIGGGHEKIIPEEKHYIEERFGEKLGEWLLVQDEIIRTLYPFDKKNLAYSFKNCGEQSKTWQQIKARAKELGLQKPKRNIRAKLPIMLKFR
jgi:hypothetical protein